MLSVSQGLVTMLQTDGSSLRFWTDNLPDGVSSFRIPDASLFASILLSAVNKDWPVAVGYEIDGDPIRDVLVLQAPPV